MSPKDFYVMPVGQDMRVSLHCLVCAMGADKVDDREGTMNLAKMLDRAKAHAAAVHPDAEWKP